MRSTQKTHSGPAKWASRSGGDVALAFAAVVSAAMAVPAMASTDSHKLVVQGATALGQKQYSTALDMFTQATGVDSTDAEALFFQGAALNRLSRHTQALEKLSAASKAGDTNPDLGFELGWAQLATGAFTDAVATLTTYTEAHPENARAYQLLGRAYLGLNQYDKASAAFATATAKDHNIKASVQTYQNLVARLQNLGVSEQIARKRAIAYGIDTAIGFNSNVIALGNSIPPTEIATGKSSPFVHVGIHAEGDITRTNSASLAAGYDLTTDFYSRLYQNDTFDHYLHADYDRKLSASATLRTRLSEDVTILGGADFRNETELRPSIVFHDAPNGNAEFAYAYSGDHYLFKATPAQTRTGHANTLSFDQSYDPATGKLQLKGGLFRVWNSANGSDWDYTSTGLSANAGYVFKRDITGRIDYTYTNSPYKNNNSIAAGPLARNDHSDDIALELLHPIKQAVDVYVRWDYTRNHSNIAFYDYTQKVSSVGFSARY